MREKKCKADACSTTFVPKRPMQVVCSPKCAIEYGEQRRRKKLERQRRQETRAAREGLKGYSDLAKEAQTAFNAYIRFRDRDQPCISCGEKRPPKFTGGAWDCGHFLTIGAHPELRFCELNAHKQCKSCNSGVQRRGRTVRAVHDPERHATIHASYRANLIGRVGLRSVEWLEGPHEAANWTLQDLRNIRDECRRKLRDLKRTSPDARAGA